MADSKHTLEIEVKTADFASQSLENIGEEGVEAQESIDKATNKTTDSLEDQKSSMIELGDTGKKFAAIAGSAMASVGAGVSLATANMDSLAGSAAAAAGSIAAGFAAGGPVGGALAIAAAGVGALIFAFRQADEASEQWLADMTAGLKEAEDALIAFNDAMKAQNLTMEQRVYMNDLLLDSTRQLSKEEAAHLTIQEFQRRDLEARLALADDEVAAIQAKIEAQKEYIESVEDANTAAAEVGGFPQSQRANYEELRNLEAMLKAREELRDTEEAAAREAMRQADELFRRAQEQEATLEDQAEAAKAVADAVKAARKAMEGFTVETKKAKVETKKTSDSTSAIAKAAREAQEAIMAGVVAMKTANLARADYLLGLAKEVELMRARLDGTEDILLREREIAEAQERGGEEAVRLVKERHALEDAITRQAEEQADAAARKAAADKEGSKATKEAAAATQQVQGKQEHRLTRRRRALHEAKQAREERQRSGTSLANSFSGAFGVSMAGGERTEFGPAGPTSPWDPAEGKAAQEALEKALSKANEQLKMQTENTKEVAEGIDEVAMEVGKVNSEADAAGNNVAALKSKVEQLASELKQLKDAAAMKAGT